LAYDLERPCQFRGESASRYNTRCMPSGLAEDVPHPRTFKKDLTDSNLWVFFACRTVAIFCESKVLR
jgi:hypothetical protein